MSETVVAQLHGSLLRPAEWWACSEPERLPDRTIIYDERCRACRIKARADLARNGDGKLDDIDDPSVPAVWLSEIAGGDADG